MDVVRTSSTSRRSLKWVLIVLVLIGTAGTITAGLARLKPALPSFDRATVVLDKVQRGTMFREVKGNGTLVPVDVQLVTTRVGGQIIEVLVQPGIEVSLDTVLVRLRDRQMDAAVKEAERDLEAANADLRQFDLQQEALQINLKVEVETARANYEDAREQAEIDEAMARRGVKSPRQWQISVGKAARNEMLYEAQVERAAIGVKSREDQRKSKQDAVARAEDRLTERREQLDSLVIKAGTTGVLQQLGQPGAGLQVGQQVGPGALMAKISNPKELKAVIFVPQVQARDIVAGQPVKVDTLNGVVEGRVNRIDAQVLNERVEVDVTLVGSLPNGARPDLSVQAQIEVARLDDVLFVRKPPFCQENSRLEVFQIQSDGATASRTMVEFGRGAEYSIEVTSGLKAGDQIIVSDTSRWKAHQSVQLK